MIPAKISKNKKKEEKLSHPCHETTAEWLISLKATLSIKSKYPECFTKTSYNLYDITYGKVKKISKKNKTNGGSSPHNTSQCGQLTLPQIVI